MKVIVPNKMTAIEVARAITIATNALVYRPGISDIEQISLTNILCALRDNIVVEEEKEACRDDDTEI